MDNYRFIRENTYFGKLTEPKKFKEFSYLNNGTVVMAGFPGVGKTYFTKAIENRDASKLTSNIFTLNVLDLDSSDFSKSRDFPTNYINAIKKNLGKYDIIFVSTHKNFLDALSFEDIIVSVVYPRKEIKEYYIDRYKFRKSSKTFIKFMDDNWDNFIDDLNSIQYKYFYTHLLDDLFCTNIQRIIESIFGGYINVDNLDKISDETLTDLITKILYNVTYLFSSNFNIDIELSKPINILGVVRYGEYKNSVDDNLYKKASKLKSELVESYNTRKNSIDSLIKFVEELESFNGNMIAANRFNPVSSYNNLSTTLLKFGDGVYETNYTPDRLSDDLTYLKEIKNELTKRNLI